MHNQGHPSEERCALVDAQTLLGSTGLLGRLGAAGHVLQKDGLGCVATGLSALWVASRSSEGGLIWVGPAPRLLYGQRAGSALAQDQGLRAALCQRVEHDVAAWFLETLHQAASHLAATTLPQLRAPRSDSGTFEVTLGWREWDQNIEGLKVSLPRGAAAIGLVMDSVLPEGADALAAMARLGRLEMGA